MVVQIGNGSCQARVEKGEACCAVGCTEGDYAAVGDGTLYNESLSVDKRSVITHVFNGYFTFHRLFQYAMVAAYPLEERVFE